MGNMWDGVQSMGAGTNVTKKGARARVWIEWGKTDDEGAPDERSLSDAKMLRSDVSSKPYVVALTAWRLVFSLGAQVIVLTG